MNNLFFGRAFFEEKLDLYKVWINNARNKQHMSWEELKYAGKGNSEGLGVFLKSQSENNFWNITCDEWYQLIEAYRAVEENSSSGYIGEPHKPIISIPTSNGSCWVNYKKKLINNPNFSNLSIERIEKTSQKILSQLEQKTNVEDPIRGMVVGNVQSGKTANMAGLIAMAADYGYNFFIILTGTIENLRVQTKNRLLSDLTNDSILHFISLENLTNKTQRPDRLQDLNLNISHNLRYINVCLKNSTRLKNLINWLNKDLKSKEQLKILLIDDEADQASINTKNVDGGESEQSIISKHIKNIVFGKNNKGQVSPYACMNYIGYTATPYANFLNEANEDSLYPKNFICVLKSPAEYLGPEQIFGVAGINDGLNIVNVIEKDDIEQLSSDAYDIPNSLKEALMWFICTVSIARFWHLKMPVSMLIHTSQKVQVHFDLSNKISNYLNQIDENTFLNNIKNTYEEQINQFTLDMFKENLPEYQGELKDYPDFCEILPIIKTILGYGITHIKLDDEGNLSYNEGIHLCVDNCRRSNNNDYMMRIIYPDSDNPIMEKSPAFIVIGGTTLSRGLTLSGLTTSYFLRTTNQADTLMQMGRWFGYRTNYELLPRLWLSSESISRYRRLTKLDYDLREEINSMEVRGLSPKSYAPRLDNFPDYKLLVLTAKNKMQKAIEYQCTFYNKASETTLFYRDNDIIQDNFNVTYDFLDNLGPVDTKRINGLNNPFKSKKGNCNMWFDVDYNKILNFLGNIKIPNQEASFSNIDELKEWYSKQYNAGNIKNFTVVAGSNAVKKNNDVVLKSNNITIHLLNRSRVEAIGSNAKNYDDYIDLRVISQPNDRLVDIDCSKLNKYELEELMSNEISFKQKRTKYGSNDTPLLVVYFIDKDSGKDKEYQGNQKLNRLPLYTLNLSNHLIGYYIYIPYGQLDTNPGYITVKLNYDDEDKLEGEEYED